MSFSSFDFLSPKITLNYYGHHSHVSRIGGLLSICFLIIICILIFYCFWELIQPKFYSSFIYEEDVNDKIIQKINFIGINHFIQIYSYSNNGYFSDIDNKNVIIYGIKENNKIYNNNINILNLDLSDTEHWLYDNCNKIKEIQSNLFSKISETVSNYTKTICIRYYYSPSQRKYYEIGNEGYEDPYLESNNLKEKKYSYKILIKKCLNNTFINNYMGYICNSENQINEYLDIYKEIFIYFTNNRILPLNFKKPFETYFYSISSSLKPYSYFETNIIFIQNKVKAKKGQIVQVNKDFSSYTLNSYYSDEKLNINESNNLLGLFNLYLNNKILTYEIICPNIIDILSKLGGLMNILFFAFETLNYINHHYTIIKNTKELFKITSGIEPELIDSKYLFDNMRHFTTNNYKLKQINTNEELSRKNFSPIVNRKKLKLPEPSPKARLSCKKNNVLLYPNNFISNKKNNNIISKRNTNTFNIKNDKRKSYLSQGYLLYNKEKKEIKDNNFNTNNQSYNEDLSYNEELNEENSNKENDINFIDENFKKENNIRNEQSRKSVNECFQNVRNKKSRKNNLQLPPTNKHILDKKDRKNSHRFLRNPNPERHKSINYSNQKKIIRNNIFNKNYLISKVASDLINDSSKHMLANNKNLLMTINLNNKTKLDENNNRAEFNNDNTDIANSTKNLNNVNSNQNIDPSAILKTIIKNKLKLEIAETNGLNINQNYFNKKIHFFSFFKSLFACNKKIDNKIGLIHNFRLKLLSEEHMYKNHINLYLIEKIFQIDEPYSFDIKELYNNL